MTKYELLLMLAFSLALVSGLIASKYFDPTLSNPQLYTVRFDGIDYQDLEQIQSTTQYSIYRTKAGKRITFKGIFYEVEQ